MHLRYFALALDLLVEEGRLLAVWVRSLSIARTRVVALQMILASPAHVADLLGASGPFRDLASLALLLHDHA